MDTMKKVVISGVKETKIVELPIPVPFEDWVLVKVHAVPICTEWKAWKVGRHYPGHEAAGEVVAVAKPCEVKVGDRVTVMPGMPCGHCDLCRQGEYIHCQSSSNYREFVDYKIDGDTHVQYLLKPSRLLAPMPDGVSYEKGSLACCALGPVMGACDNMNVDPFDVVLITGLGPVGLGGVVISKFRRAKVIGVDCSEYRRNKAVELGADLVLDPDNPDIVNIIKSFEQGKGPSACLECAGEVSAQRLCIDTVRRRGKIALIGECGDDLPIRASSDFIRTGITLFGQWHYNLNLIPKIMQVIKESPAVDKLISHVVPMSGLSEALALNAAEQTAKVIMKPWDNQ